MVCPPGLSFSPHKNNSGSGHSQQVAVPKHIVLSTSVLCTLCSQGCRALLSWLTWATPLSHQASARAFVVIRVAFMNSSPPLPREARKELPVYKSTLASELLFDGVEGWELGCRGDQ